jgi:50S ribosomal subunit-associated GTPase HflX
VALVGSIPNVGKSTLMNAIGKVMFFVENKLFTLDTTVRKVVLKSAFLPSDTVGFIENYLHN